MSKDLLSFLKNILISCLISTILINFTYISPAFALNSEATNYYRTKTIHNPDGIGKYYLNREIAKVMGHQAMMWLERESRQKEEKPQLLWENLALKPTDIVADIGAGTGYLTFPLASLVPEGKIYAVDIQPEMLDVINWRKQENKVKNVETVLGNLDNPNLPKNSIDLALMVDAYHEFEYPREMMESLYQALKPGGRVILVEYRQENPLLMIKPLHKMSQKQVKREMKAINLQWQSTKQFLPEQHFMVFKKSE